MVLSYLKKLMLIPIPVLLVFGFFCHTSFAQDFVSQHYGDHTQHEQGVHTSNCGMLNTECLMQHSHEQLTIAVVQNFHNNNQKTKKIPDITPVFLIAPHTDDVEKVIDKQIIVPNEGSSRTNLYRNWPVVLPRSHLS